MFQQLSYLSLIFIFSKRSSVYTVTNCTNSYTGEWNWKLLKRCKSIFRASFLV